MQYVRRVCGKIVSSYGNFLCTAGNKGFGNLLNVDFVRKKIDLHGNNTPLSISDVRNECCCLPGKLQKQGKFVASFVSNLGDWRAAKTCACLLRFSVLNLGSTVVTTMAATM